MKLAPPVNENYAATVVRIDNLVPLAGCDNVVGAPLLGYQAIVSKAVQVGDIGIVFTAETQLDFDFVHQNNLHRHAELNKDPFVAGYLEDNRRVKALKFRGHRSDALFLPLSALHAAVDGVDVFALGLGFQFDTLNGVPICQKYETAAVKAQKAAAAKAGIKLSERLDSRTLPEHFDTVSYFKNKHRIPNDTQVTITQKLHGTSLRAGNVPVKRKLSWLERLAKRFGIPVDEYEYDYVYGSRKVIKDPGNPDLAHYYDTDVHALAGDQHVHGKLPKGFIVYGELIGFTAGGGAIQKDYTYNVPVGQNRFYVYRVAFLTPEGQLVDLSWPAVREFCERQGFLHVPEIARGGYMDEIAEDVEGTLDKRYHDGYLRLVEAGYADDLLDEPLPLSAPSTKKKPIVDEGICIRAEGITPVVLKAKSPIFLGFETAALDAEVEDLEAVA